jgi:peptide/nickel transport system substrate-binding protein
VLRDSALVTGDFQPPPEIVERARAGNRQQLTSVATTSTEWVALNTSRPPFDDADVRKAVIAGFDRAALRHDYGGEATGRLATHFLPPTVPGFHAAGGTAGPGYDFLNASGKPMPDVSARYFRKAGFAAGLYTGTHRVLVVGAKGTDSARVARQTKDNLGLLGFRVRLRLVSYETMNSKYCADPQSEVAVCPNVGLTPWVADGYSVLMPGFMSTSLRGTANASRLAIPEIDAAIEKANAVSDPAARARTWGRIDREITAQAPAVPWLWDNSIYLASDNVKLAANAANGGLVDLAYTSLK